jgi:DNA topoisomerase-1
MAAKWILRKGTPKSGFRYVHEDGRAVRDARTLARIDAIRIPPAWRDVHVAASATHAIQAWGFDARGRRQYRYHDRAYEKGQLRKYYRVRMLARELPRVRAILERDAGRRAPTRDAVAALVVRLISEGYFRVGGDRAEKENGTFGITTLRKKHVQCEEGQVVFRYVGKGGKKQRQVIANPELARAVERLRKTPGPRIFQWKDDEGWHPLAARDVNAYIKERIGPSYTAKDFRTWGGTLRAATVLAELGPARSATEAKRNVAMAMRMVSADLGNTPTICRKSYVHPMVVARYLDEGETIRLARARGKPAVRQVPEEKALIAFLDRHFPERRRKPRASAAA